jgi:hypothetical protein
MLPLKEGLWSLELEILGGVGEGDERNRTTTTLALKYRVTPLAPSGAAVLVQSAGIPIAIMQADGGEALR